MKKCYEFFDCNKLDCVRHETDDLQCWEIEGTLCYDHSNFFTQLRALVKSKIDVCSECTYYTIYNNTAKKT